MFPWPGCPGCSFVALNGYRLRRSSTYLLTWHLLQNPPAPPARRLSIQTNASTAKDAPTSPSASNAKASATQYQSSVPLSTLTHLAANRNKIAATNANASFNRPQPHPLQHHPKRRLFPRLPHRLRRPHLLHQRLPNASPPQ